MNRNDPPSLNLVIDISGNKHHIGKTLLAARLVKFFQEQGIKDVTFRDGETIPDAFQKLVENSHDVLFSFGEYTHVMINENIRLRAFTAEGLKERYGESGEHPDFTKELWIAAVRNKHTDDGYWQWLFRQLTS